MPDEEETFEIKLQVRYNGLKATQYFSKFTPESENVFREDLFSLRLPYPKREKTTFISYGCIECAWPAVRKDGTLHKQIALKSQAPKDLLKELSISNITTKYIYPRKRKHPQNSNPYAGSQPSKNLYFNPPRPPRPKASGSGSFLPSNAQGDLSRFQDGGWDASRRPHKMAKLDHGDIASASSSSETPFPTFTNLPPLPPRKAPERIHVPTPSSSKGPRPSESSHPSNDRVENSAKRTDMPAPSTFSFQKPPGVAQAQATPSIFQKPPDFARAGPSNFSLRKPPDVAQAGPSVFGFQKPPGVEQAAPLSVPSIFSFSNFAHVGQTAVSSIPGIFGFNNGLPMNSSVGQSAPYASSVFGVNNPPADSDVQMDDLPAPSISSSKNPPHGPKASMGQSATAHESPTPTQMPPYTRPPYTRPPYTRRAYRMPPYTGPAYPLESINSSSTGPGVVGADYTKKPAETASSPPIKQEYNELLLDFLRDEAPRTQKVTSAETHQPKAKSLHFQPAGRLTEEKNNQMDKEKGASLVQDFLNSLKSKTNVSSQGPASSTTPHQEQWSQTPLPKVEAQNTHTPPWQPQTYSQTSTSAPPFQKEQRSEHADWYDSSEVPPFRGPQVDTVMPSVLPTPPLSAAPLNLNTWSWSASTQALTPGGASHNPPAVVEQASKAPAPSSHPPTPYRSLDPAPPVPLAPQIQAVSSSSSATDIPADARPDSMKRKRNALPRKEDAIAIQNLLREASNIKREIAAKMAREGVVIAELKELNSTVVPRHIKLGHDTPEEVKEELARLKHELANERRLREEAENAIMDVRRECKEPFVVPSLLDAFVEVSKLTTRSLRPPQPPQPSHSDTDLSMG
ncbi:hypothetical protein CVT25_004226 [Psilocybe cyanescens]|uniref:Uncharacterized protein n=1 Tax=Psilocybe cyanescens TaxID=93625 RepID=A0A409X306_PSICY|nr:hypothetical protein CVT25_004226 [Psilocybe cyanescens]